MGYLRKKLSCVATPLCEKRALAGVVPGWSRTKFDFARAKARRGVHMNIINLTPHTVNICTEDGDIECSFKSEGVARASQVAVLVTSMELSWSRCVSALPLIFLTLRLVPYLLYLRSPQVPLRRKVVLLMTWCLQRILSVTRMAVSSAAGASPAYKWSPHPLRRW